MKNLSRIIVLCFGILIANCSPVWQVSYDYDSSFDFTNLKTYSWLPLKTEAEIDQLIEARIRRTVNNYLESKGYQMVTNNPDFLILAKVGTRMDTWSGGGYYGGGWSTQIESGTLLLDFIDSESKNLIWRGNSSAALDYNETPERLNKLVDEVVQKILENFPPPSY